MLIRSKIILNLFFFIAVVLIIGLGFFYLNKEQFRYYNDYNGYVQMRKSVKDISDIFSEQIQAYDYYMYLNEDSERYNFIEKKEQITLLIDNDPIFELKKMRELKEKLVFLNAQFLKSFNIVQRKGRAAAIQETEKEIISMIAQTREVLGNQLKELNEKIEVSKNVAESYKNRTLNLLVVFFSIGVLIIAVFSFNLYRTITNPLRKVENAARILGQGNLDYQIKIDENNEFSNIADSFNKMVKDLKEFHLKITQMGKMAAVGELAGGVAHEINNPLSGVLGHTQMLLKRIGEKSEVYPALKKIEHAAIRCRNIVGDLLDFSRQEKQEMKKQSINKILEDTFLLCENEIISKNIQLNKDYAPGLPDILVSPRTIQHAFLNIINNSILAMPKGGALTVSTGIAQVGGATYLEVKFRDTGVGFDAETATHIFEPFFTTREVGQGTGLGLSLTYRIIKTHKGYIKGESDGPGKGAVFTIQFPV